MIIYNNVSGQIIPDVLTSVVPGFKYKNGVTYYRTDSYTEIKDQPLTFIFKSNDKVFTGKVIKIEDDVIYVYGHGSFELDRVVVVVEVDQPIATNKFDQLQTLWKSGESQISKDVKLINFIRLVDGDLSHIGDALLNGEDVFYGGEDIGSLSYNADSIHYTIKKKQVTLTLDVDLVDELLEILFDDSPLQAQIKEQL